MKLTPELIAQSRSYLNALKDRELDLRGNKIPVIENLGVTKDQHDTIDLTDNSITSLSNLPRLLRLRTLLLSNNVIVTIHPSISTSAPNLTTLVLTNNALSELGDLEALSGCKNLTYLSLMGCPVREKKWYREWVLWVCKKVRVLDFQRIKDKERVQAKTLFLTPDSLPTALATSLSSTRATVSASSVTANFTPAEGATKTFVPGASGRLLTAEEKKRVEDAIKNASSVEEVRKIESMMREGWVPPKA